MIAFGAMSIDAALAVDIPVYQQLENIPGAEGNKTFPDYMLSIYKLAFWIIGISAMFMISVGGFIYVTSAGNTSSAGLGKTYIKDAIIGLLVGLFAWILLYTINPDLTSFNYTGLTTGMSSHSNPSAGTYVASGERILSGSGSCRDASGKPVSPQSNINEARTGQVTACFHGCTSSSAPCTEKVTLSPAMLAAMNDLKGYTVTSLAGGSHANDSAHYKGLAMDIQPRSSNRADWVALREAFIQKGALGHSEAGTFCEDSKGALQASCVGAGHIHVRFAP
jgi:hypothetical protein